MLFDNYRQNEAISLMEKMSVSRLGAKQHFIRVLESQGLLSTARSSSCLRRRVRRAQGARRGRTRPEPRSCCPTPRSCCSNSCWIPTRPRIRTCPKELRRYFPQLLQESVSPSTWSGIAWKREIIATAVTNSMVNRGATFVLRMARTPARSRPGSPAPSPSRVRCLDARELWAQIEALDGRHNGNAQIDALLVIWASLRNMTRWLLSHSEATPTSRGGARHRRHAGMRCAACTTPSRRAGVRGYPRWIDAGFP